MKNLALILSLSLIYNSAPASIARNWVDVSAMETFYQDQDSPNDLRVVFKDKNFTQGDFRVIRHLGGSLDKNDLNNTLLVVAEFVVDRDISTFTYESMTHPADIMALSSVELSQVKRITPNKIRFKSKMSAVIKSLYADNELTIYYPDDFHQDANIERMSGLYSAANPPDVMSYQQSKNFTDFLKDTHVLTMYYDLGDGQTRIRSFTLTHTQELNFILRRGMKSTIKASLVNIPILCEINGQKW
jgi:hypothetical protein